MQSTLFSGIVLCINIPKSSDRGGFFLWFYAWKKRGNVDRTFLRSINGYLLWGVFRDFILCYICMIGYVNGMFRKVFYPDDIKLPMILISGSDFVLQFSNLSASFPSKKKIRFRVLSVPYHDTGDGLYFSNYNRTLFYNTEDQQTPRND